MSKPNHICKNPDCGVAYFWCDGCNINKGIEWGKVGCCPECAQIYWDLIEKSRNKSVVEVEVLVKREELPEQVDIKPKRKYKQEQVITEEE